MLEIWKIAYGTSWKLRKKSSIRTGEDVGLYQSIISIEINIQ